MKGYHEPGAPITIVLRAMRVLSLGVRRKVYSGHCLHIPRAGGFPVSAGIRNGTRISWRCGMAAGSGFLAAPVSRRVRAAGRPRAVPLAMGPMTVRRAVRHAVSGAWRRAGRSSGRLDPGAVTVAWLRARCRGAGIMPVIEVMAGVFPEGHVVAFPLFRPAAVPSWGGV